MATWKRLTNSENNKIDINMDNVTYMLRDKDDYATILYLVSSDPNHLVIKETIEEIHKQKVMSV
jgi:hypothetical protein